MNADGPTQYGTSLCLLMIVKELLDAFYVDWKDKRRLGATAMLVIKVKHYSIMLPEMPTENL